MSSPCGIGLIRATGLGRMHAAAQRYLIAVEIIQNQCQHIKKRMHLAGNACVCRTDRKTDTPRHQQHGMQAQQQQAPLQSCTCSSSNRVHTDPLKVSTSGGDRHFDILVSSGTTPCHAGVCSFVCLRSGTCNHMQVHPSMACMAYAQYRRCATVNRHHPASICS